MGFTVELSKADMNSLQVALMKPTNGDYEITFLDDSGNAVGAASDCDNDSKNKKGKKGKKKKDKKKKKKQSNNNEEEKAMDNVDGKNKKNKKKKEKEICTIIIGMKSSMLGRREWRFTMCENSKY